MSIELNTPPLLEVKNLQIAFPQADRPDFQAVKGLSFRLEAGQTLAVVGESGSGKSVTALSLMSLLDPSAKVSAEVFSWERNGKALDLRHFSEKQWTTIRGKEMGMVFQEPMTSLNPVMKVGEQVAEALRIHQKSNRKQARSLTLDLFEKVELPRPAQLYEAYPHQLSGGQKQRIMIAMAVSCKPALLIADEPTTALDVTVQKRILELIRTLQQEMHMACLFITHDLGLVKDFADSVLVMKNGERVEEGPVDTVFQAPQSPYTRGLLACRPSMHHRVERLLTVEDFQTEGPQPEAVHISPAAEAANLEKLSQNDALIRVENLRTWFPMTGTPLFGPKKFVKAVDDVSFTIQKGEVLGLVGESGSGKSTIGRNLLRLIPPTSGGIWYESRDLLALPPEALRLWRRKAQMVFQDPFSSLNPRMTIGEAILEPLNVHHLGEKKSRKDRVHYLLEKVQLHPDHYHRYPHEFSGGQRQRIVIARALALEPEFLVCDEAVSALDVSVQAQVLNLLKDLQRDFGLTYLFITHDLSVVRFLCDRILILQQGKLVESGATGSVLDAPQSDYTRELVQAAPGQ
jgi:peptide/nickel transport system ATP-binding protein